MTKQEFFERIRLEELEVLSEVIDCCREILRNPICLEQAIDAREELEFAISEYEKLWRKIYCNEKI